MATNFFRESTAHGEHMTFPTRRSSDLAATAVGVVAVAALPASASTGTAVINGSGVISPPLALTAPGNPNTTVTFVGQGAAVTDDFQGAFSCTVNGNDTIGTVASGAGGF